MNTQSWSGDLTTRTGFKFHVRPISSNDEPALAELFTHVTPDDLRFRFLTGINIVDHNRLAALIDVDHRQKENFLALAEDGATVIATAMLACDDAMETGEVAISIRSDYKGRGVSWKLLEYVARFAEAAGVQTLQSIESYANHSAIELERNMGFTARPYPGDATLVLVERKLPLPVDA
ncbi:N-acetyltransferase GCN5 [Sphingopyxis fribergensis]|jgi:GNAT superfamily N-acetyltransferase|uniref:N-acetyltransferase GCN5 n=1 Tax=Sphingopyxis fribergensis TaxID=1515612 RepID=A0A0A7PPZ5_9SPHN|nr:GNAT family N-acetyltransferase [Sphingopyxis fribergensis]AJA11328.1 N-acetyltransferase GCN5 [Sphingopyxis fribergensis]